MDFECKIIRMILFSGSEFSKIFGIKKTDKYSFFFDFFCYIVNGIEMRNREIIAKKLRNKKWIMKINRTSKMKN